MARPRSSSAATRIRLRPIPLTSDHLPSPNSLSRANNCGCQSDGMRRIAFLISALIAVVASRADAESQWREYAYPDQQFSAAFPAPPEVMRIPFEGDDGRRVTEVVYYLQQGSERFQVAVFDLLRAGI